MSPLTFNQYEGVWRRHLRPTFGRLPLGAIDQPLITRYKRAKFAEGLSESTFKNSLVPLCGMLTDAVAEGLIPNNPLRAPKRARHRGGGRHDVLDLQVKRPPPKHLEMSEALRLLDAVPHEHLGVVLLALTTGFRRNELLGLQWEWIDFRCPARRPSRPALLAAGGGDAAARPRDREVQVRLGARGSALHRRGSPPRPPSRGDRLRVRQSADGRALARDPARRAIPRAGLRARRPASRRPGVAPAAPHVREHGGGRRSKAPRGRAAHGPSLSQNDERLHTPLPRGIRGRGTGAPRHLRRGPARARAPARVPQAEGAKGRRSSRQRCLRGASTVCRAAGARGVVAATASRVAGRAKRRRAGDAPERGFSGPTQARWRAGQPRAILTFGIK